MADRISNQVVCHAEHVDVDRIYACFSCENEPQFRYVLRLPFRDRADAPDKVVAILKNPSAANEYTADVTIRRVEEYVHRHYCNAGELVILNLFAYRATDPKRLGSHGDIVGPCNNYNIRLHCGSATDIILAWGGTQSGEVPATEYDARITTVLDILRPHENKLKLWIVPPTRKQKEQGLGQNPRCPLHGRNWAYDSAPCRWSQVAPR